ncbi:Cullin binding-domain-containing protein [Papiliotrema laurentii]|uniref:Defective in cullin neddylation protein n=1 Tax=Papiliotrema laurentii TaxID=5418 RepID=A0AAD9FUT2_PAPLA|nr:Cullin binding-domain-containing protein [Papiliotrema laurentii]
MMSRAEAARGSSTSGGSTGSSAKAQEKKLGEIWERFKDPSDPKLIKIDGTMELCNELDIDPESDVVLFCLAADLGSKTTGEWEKGPFVSGWAKMPGNIDSFKKVYMHTFDLAKAPGSRTLGLETALSLWPIFVEPALDATPSALSHIQPGSPPSTESSVPPQFTKRHFELWIQFQTKKNKAVSKDTWNLFIDFIRTIDADFKDYDEEAAWPSTIDDFVEYVRANI